MHNLRSKIHRQFTIILISKIWFKEDILCLIMNRPSLNFTKDRSVNKNVLRGPGMNKTSVDAPKRLYPKIQMVSKLSIPRIEKSAKTLPNKFTNPINKLAIPQFYLLSQIQKNESDSKNNPSKQKNKQIQIEGKQNIFLKICNKNLVIDTEVHSKKSIPWIFKNAFTEQNSKKFPSLKRFIERANRLADGWRPNPSPQNYNSNGKSPKSDQSKLTLIRLMPNPEKEILKAIAKNESSVEKFSKDKNVLDQIERRLFNNKLWNNPNKKFKKEKQPICESSEDGKTEGDKTNPSLFIVDKQKVLDLIAQRNTTRSDRKIKMSSMDFKHLKKQQMSNSQKGIRFKKKKNKSEI